MARDFGEIAEEPAGQVNQVGENGGDFVLDDPERGNDSTGSTREMPGAPAVTREMPAVPAAAGASCGAIVMSGPVTSCIAPRWQRRARRLKRLDSVFIPNRSGRIHRPSTRSDLI